MSFRKNDSSPLRGTIWITAALILTSCSQKTTNRLIASGPFTEHAQLAEFVENGVGVKIALETGPDQQALLRATFTPTEAGFHLYSKDLPVDGIKGIGVPTRFTVAPGAGIISVGEPFSDVEPKQLRVKGMTFPIYPEGAVKIRLPIKIDSSSGETTAKASFSYMACSKEICRVPVQGKQLTLTIPKLQ